MGRVRVPPPTHAAVSRTLALTPPLAPAPDPVAGLARVRVATWTAPSAPPIVEELADEPAGLVEAVCDAVAARSALPAPAVREVVENLVHARFRDAVVSVMDEGATVRVSDRGPGIADLERALEPGYTTADAGDRELIRGVGSGLPLASAAMAEAGGTLVIDQNLDGGAAVTLRIPSGAGAPAALPACSGTAREILAVLLEIGAATPARLAQELARPRAECGRELAHLEHRGLVRREPEGSRTLTEAGSRLVATLF